MLGLRGPALAWHVILPDALPRILIGLQAALAFGWVSVIAAEYVGAPAGIGYLITKAAIAKLCKSEGRWLYSRRAID